MAEQPGIRLNKYLAESGVCSRREADRWIEEGLVRINGHAATLGTRVNSGDQVTMRGQSLRPRPRRVILAYHKPAGVTCTTDQRDPSNIVNAVAYRERIFPVGRLDKASEGLIFLTNDGDIVNKILRAGNAHEKEYIVTVDRPIRREFLERMAAGVPILNTVTKPCQIRPLSSRSFGIILTQGLNRQIRRMCEYLGYEVTRLQRIRIMKIKLGELKLGRWRLLSSVEQASLNRLLADSSNVPATATEDDGD